MTEYQTRIMCQQSMRVPFLTATHKRNKTLREIVLSYVLNSCDKMAHRGNVTNVRNPGRDISFPIFIRKEIKTRKLERKSKQKISRLIDLLYRLNDIISL